MAERQGFAPWYYRHNKRFCRRIPGMNKPYYTDAITGRLIFITPIPARVYNFKSRINTWFKTWQKKTPKREDNP